MAANSETAKNLMPGRDIIVIGASAGGVEALVQLIKRLPSDLPVALFVVLHVPSIGISVLPQILNRVGKIPALHPADKTPIAHGHIYVAPPDYHLLIQPEQVRLSRGPRENRHRPAIDVLFRAAAQVYGRRVVGIVLSGALDDGTAGLSVIKARGGVALVQEPTEATFDSMPRSAIAHVAVDWVLKIQEMPSILEQFAHDTASEDDVMSEDELEQEAQIVAQDKAALERGERPGTASTLTCPDCGGVLWELDHGDLLRFRCHVGHAYSADSLVAGQADAVETALWSSVRALEEKAALSRRMAIQAKQQGRFISEAQFLDRATSAERDADLVRRVLLQHTFPKESQDNPK